MLTKREAYLLADVAESYPPGHGDSFFYDEAPRVLGYAIWRITFDEKSIKFG